MDEGIVENDKNVHALRSFFDRTTSHPFLQKAFREVMDNLNSISTGKVYLVFGPSGVGKTTLCKRIKQTYIEQSNNNMNRGEIPIISLELPSPDNGKFNWKDFYQRILLELNEPLIHRKINFKQNSDNNIERKFPNYLPSTAPELRKSLENALFYRGTKVVLLDEAQHLLKMASGKRLQDQMDSLKSLANMTQTKFVLFGTYELMQFLNLNGQLSRRTEEIHFPRYNAQKDEDLRIFMNVINTFQANLPYKVETNLIDHWEFFYERSIGCVGILKNWLDKCLEKASTTGENFISFATLENYSPSPAKAIKMAEEALNGESLISQQEEQIIILQNILGLKNDKIQNENNDTLKETNKKKNSKVGHRNPIRDKVGFEDVGS